MKTWLFAVFGLFALGCTSAFGQQISDTIEFRDTQYSLVADSFSNNMGIIPPTKPRLVKHFKYIGTDSLSVFITRTWTTDPHYICKFPREPLIPGEIYELTICFWHQNRIGAFQKTMGINLSNGERITFRFKGVVMK